MTHELTIKDWAITKPGSGGSIILIYDDYTPSYRPGDKLTISHNTGTSEVTIEEVNFKEWHNITVRDAVAYYAHLHQWDEIALHIQGIQGVHPAGFRVVVLYVRNTLV